MAHPETEYYANNFLNAEVYVLTWEDFQGIIK